MRERQIKRDGWIFFVAYLFTSRENEPKTSVDLCSLFWRLVIMAIPISAFVALATFAMVLFAFTLNDFAIWLVSFISNFSWERTVASARSPEVLTAVMIFGIAVGVIICVVGMGFSLVFFPPKIRRWLASIELIRLAIDYIKAKKEKVCPIYKII